MYSAFVNLALRTFVVPAVMAFLPAIAFACSCGASVPVLEAFDHSEVVLTARASSVEKVKPGKTEFYVNNVRWTKLIVEKVYKGNVRAGDELKFAQGGGADCVWTFSDRDIGKRYLLYLGLPRRDAAHWIAFTCGRSAPIERATEDLLYLDKMDQVGGKTRVSGKYHALSGTSGLNVANRKLRIVGRQKTYETTTDKDGVFEIYDLPPGDYQLEPEIPKGWKLDLDWLWFSSSALPKQSSEKSVAFKLEAKKHASIDLAFKRATDAP